MDGKVRVKNHGMGYSNNAAKSKNKQKESGVAGGKVTQFKNIDDIPNINEDDIQWSEQQQPSTLQYMQQQQQFQDHQQYPSSGYSKPSYIMSNSNEEDCSKQKNNYNSNSYRNHYQEQSNYYSAPQQANDHYQKDFSSNMLHERHHEDFRNRQIQEEIEEAEIEEELQDGDSSDGDNPLPVPPHKLNADEDGGYHHGDRKVGAKQSKNKHNNNMNIAAPPLPYDLKKNAEKKLTGKEKLFFSKEPRPVEFK